MTTIEKLKLMEEMEARNEARRQQYIRDCGAYDAIQISARGIMASIDILAKHYNLERNELFELLVNTMCVMTQIDEQGGVMAHD